MRPLKGLVLSVNKRDGLKIRLESGPIITLPYNKHTHTGQKILIRYDFTKNQAMGIINPYSEIKIPGPTKIEKGGKDNDPEIIETLLAY